MQAFAKLLDSLSFSGSTLAKRRLMAAYFKATADPERGWALGALAGTLSFSKAKPNVIRELVASRIDPVLYALSRDYVGDMAETVRVPGGEGRAVLVGEGQRVRVVDVAGGQVGDLFAFAAADPGEFASASHTRVRKR